MNPETNITAAPVTEVTKTRGRKPKTKQYFTKETEDAILLYNQTNLVGKLPFSPDTDLQQ